MGLVLILINWPIWILFLIVLIFKWLVDWKKKSLNKISCFTAAAVDDKSIGRVVYIPFCKRNRPLNGMFPK
ncbi:MAG: hypothetical protein DA408_08485 [Bacteroidetes bacterium]|nr:MAG: hypothetical protein C7N36_21420 [Bacteroidota bacterium]PTM12990.1 MAG: hypothetical protein DA408_08485 [Bacteroidota bacterium]